MVDTSWLDDVRAPAPTPTAEIMREGAQEGKDRVWWCDGKHVWFRRVKSNPATLQRHNRFVADGDYEYIRTDDDVELYRLKEQSIFAIKAPQTIDLSKLSFYDVKRMACKAAMKDDWQAFEDIVAYIRSVLQRNVGDKTAARWTQTWCDMVFGDHYADLCHMVEKRNGPSPQRINMELARLASKRGDNSGRIITLGR
jgi:hypothetical protein